MIIETIFRYKKIKAEEERTPWWKDVSALPLYVASINCIKKFLDAGEEVIKERSPKISSPAHVETSGMVIPNT